MEHLRGFLGDTENHDKDIKIFFDDRQYTYYEILKKSYDLARLLESYGYKKVFSNLKNSPLSISLYLASWIADIDIFVPINPRLVDSELENILEKESLFITDRQCSLATKEIRQLYIEDELSFFDKIPESSNHHISARCITVHISSGTTGFYQKHKHNIDQIVEYAQNRVEDLGLKQNDHLLIALSINHAFAFSYQLLPALAMGLNITIIKEFDPKLVANVINKSKVTALALLPTMYYFLIQEEISQKNNLRYLSVAGDITPESLDSLVRKKIGIPLLNGIGMTEVFGYGQNIENKESNLIKIFSDTEVKIEKFYNSDYGKIYIKNKILPLDIQQGWLETGDIGSFNDQSYELTFYGRYKDIIIKGGSNISPIELENSILKNHSIKSCVVVGKYDKVWGETIWAFLVAKREYTLAFINKNLMKYVSEYKKLDGVIYIDEIPLTATGKTDRKKLKAIINNEF